MSKVDLSELRIDESAAKPRRPLGPRVLAITVGVLIIAVAATFLWPLVRPVREVSTAAIRSASTTTERAAITTAEAVGWVEPDPFPLIVRPLVSGRIRTIDVLEGHEVVAGETVLASLDSAQLLAASDRAKALLAEREIEHVVAVAKHRKAVAHRDQHAEHRSAIADARLTVAGKETALATARGNARRLGASARAAAAALQAQQRLTDEGTGHAIALERAQAESDSADAAAATAVAEIETIERELETARERLALHQELLDNPVDLDADVEVAAAQVEHAARRLEVARTDLVIAERELDWARRVIAPASGVVMRLIAAPGHTTGPAGEGIVALYDPKKLQTRLDVLLDAVAGVHPGQEVELRSEIDGAIVKGVVSRILHESDMVNNTLQVKVRLIDPPAIWRPETLCRARFLGGSGGSDPNEPARTAAFVLPKVAVRGDRVFVLDPARGVARAVSVTIVGEDGDRVIVQGELSVTQRVIRDPVEDGERVQELQQ